MSDWVKAVVPLEVAAVWPNTRLWRKHVADGTLTVMRTIERQDAQSPWRTHLSISHAGAADCPSRYPTWDEQKEACWRFAPGKPMASFMPPEGEPYVNVHETTFHWWETTIEMLQEIR